MLDRKKALKNYEQTKKQAIRQAALEYRIAGRYLIHLDCGSETAKCVLLDKINKILK